MRLFYLLLAVFAVYYFWDDVFTASAKPASPDLTKKLYIAPLQGPPKTKGVTFGKGYLTFLASYEVTARVMSRENYRFDKESDISPMDFALGWGPMSGPNIAEKLSVSQSGRFYRYSWKEAPPVPPEKIIDSSANTHIIPANDNIRRQLDRVKKGQIVTLKGELVHYREDEEDRWWEWRSSMTRGDTGAGACELLYVEEVTVYEQ